MEAKINQYLCPYCGTKFEAYDDLKAHALSEHAGEPAPLPEGMIRLILNGDEYQIQVQPEWTLNTLIHDKLGLTSPKMFCDRGACGSCTVIMNERPILSCMTLAIECDGNTVETAEGIADQGHPLVETYVKHHAMQCGYCTPGFITTAKALLDKYPDPHEAQIRDALGGNLCRCGTYPQHPKAIMEAADILSQSRGGEQTMGNLKIRPYEALQESGMYTVGADKPGIEYQQIGKRGVRRIDGYAKASGKAVYTRDVQIPGMLYAKMMRSPYAHARILHMDTSRAEKLPGVRAVMRYDDPEIKGRTLNGSVGGPDRLAGEFSGFALKPENVILAEEAWFEGQAVGAVVAAESEEIAKEAIRLIHVEWEELPFLLDQEEALKPEAPVLLPGAESNKVEDFRELFEHGNVEKGFKEADQIIEFEARRNAHLWAGAEMPSVLARWTEQRLELWVHVQQPYSVKLLLSEQLDIPMNQITMYSPYQGCSFGERCNPADFSINGMNTLAVLMAKRTERPVKLLFDRAEKFYGESGDMMVGYFKVGAKNDGTITAVDMKNIFAVFQCTPGAEHLLENTRIPNLKCQAITADVSKAPAWWARCEQLPNAFCLTMIFDHVADALGLDPTRVALKNDGCEGHDMDWLLKYKKEHGFPERDSLNECIEAGKKAIDWDNKWHPPGEKKLLNGKLHGIAFTWDHEWDDTRGTASAAVWMENDGTVSIVAQHSDVGVNPWTTYCQVVSDELGVPFEDITIKPFDSDHIFSLMSPDGSCNLCSNAYVVRKAARKAKAKLLDLALRSFEGLTADDLDVKDRHVFEKKNPKNKRAIKDIAIMSMPMHNAVGIWTEPPIVGWSWHQHGIWGDAMETGRPRLCRQAHFMEVEVDSETGEVLVTKVVNANDVGKAISPETVEGQMYGGTYMGVGRALTEEMVWDPQTGVLLNRNLLDYKIPTMDDCPEADTVIVETEMGHGPYGTTGVGEDVATLIPALLGPAVYNAIGVRVDDFPITPQKVLKALGKL